MVRYEDREGVVVFVPQSRSSFFFTNRWLSLIGYVLEPSRKFGTRNVFPFLEIYTTLQD